ncbi:uncharacterized protein LOC128222080 [Mya arenaria]|uniref:uncharacterized protein LOC128222080 n=1 Tax=Mya arenaria TaxID=6604 RepID=UPI0022E4701E|nr:uncharacterized protein LOC128222080 [Mya arenaria]
MKIEVIFSMFTFWLVVSFITPTDSVQCLSCSGVQNLSTCQNVTVCSENQNCLENHGVSIIGRRTEETSGHVTTRRSGACFECCSSDSCNEQLCSHHLPSSCVDDETVDCAKLSPLFHICTIDYEHAAQICPKFCRLCDYADG